MQVRHVNNTESFKMNLDFLDNIDISDDDLYKIIGCDETASIDQIKCEYKIRVKKFHPDKVAQEDKTAHENYDKLRWAYDILSNEDSRGKYDSWRRSGLSVPFKAWLNLRDASRTSMHWASQPKKKLMLEDSNSSNEKLENNDKTIKSEETSRCEMEKQIEEPRPKPENSLKRKLNGWGSSGLSRRFKNYEL